MRVPLQVVDDVGGKRPLANCVCCSCNVLSHFIDMQPWNKLPVQKLLSVTTFLQC